MKQIIEKARSSLSNNSLSHQTLGKCLRENFILLHLNIIIVFYLELLYNYPSSIVTLSLICNITSNTFIIEQIKSFLLHKKDQLHYFVSQYISLSFHLLFSFFYRHNYCIAHFNFKVLLRNHDLISPNSDQSWIN
jgi:hypothetical protein